jgi:hypothetical protein
MSGMPPKPRCTARSYPEDVPDQTPTRATSIELLRSVDVDAASHTADLFESAEPRWNGGVVPRTSMHDLLSSVPGEAT